MDLKKKYDNFFYWQYKVEEEKADNPFVHEPITENSVFFHGVIAYVQGLSYERWLHFPYLEALLGYLNHIFVPAAFYMFLTEEIEIVMPHVNLEELLNLLNDSESCNKKELIPPMREFNRRLRELWNLEREECFAELEKIAVDYGVQWSSGVKLFSFFNIFQTPLELGHYMVETYENSEEADITVLEKQLGISKEEWLSICAQASENESMRSKFTEILNTRINDLL
jgi:hypothetical protein